MVAIETAAGSGAVAAVVLIGVGIGALFALLNAWQTSQIHVLPQGEASADSGLLVNQNGSEVNVKLYGISQKIAQGANAFLFREYVYLAVFFFFFSILLLLLLGFIHSWPSALFAVLSFVLGACTSVLSGFLGMRIAVYANSRTAISAQIGMGPAFITAFRAGTVMGFTLVSLGLFMLYILINIVHQYWDNGVELNKAGTPWNPESTQAKATVAMFEAIAGYGLGGSSVALFGRVGGGIYTKAADVGADLVGKVERNLPEDDPRNPAVIADNVGDNVGDIAGMGADLFGSFAESSCAAMVVAANSPDLQQLWTSMLFPLVLVAVGIVVSLLTTFFATHIWVVDSAAAIEPSLKRQILISTLIMTPAAYAVCHFFLPSSFFLTQADYLNPTSSNTVHNWHVFFCVAAGLWSGMIIGYTTEYYTSHSYTPVRELAEACKTGAATNIIFGLALGYKSVIIPVFCLAITIYVAFSLAGMFGIACGALGILSTLPISLTIDGYGPICDNAGGIAEMAGMHEEVRKKTDALDAAGNTTAAIGKGFAIGSAALVSLALFGAFCTIVQLTSVDLLQPFEFAGLLVGAMLPYWFSAMTMKSVGKAALDMVQEIRQQIREHPGILDGSEEPDYTRCISISTDASLREMMPPGALVMLTPVIVGFIFGVRALAGVLAGALVSGVQIAISSANSGGAWDNAKKYIEGGNLGADHKKHTETHKAAVVGDTVGDPLKDTSGPSLNILIKLMAIISVVFAPAFKQHPDGLLGELF